MYMLIVQYPNIEKTCSASLCVWNSGTANTGYIGGYDGSYMHNIMLDIIK